METYNVFIFIDGHYQKVALLAYDGLKFYLNYGRHYIKKASSLPLDPINLPLYDKTFESETLFGALQDCAPDRWGQYLLEKKFGGELRDIDYILANGLEHVGAISFSPETEKMPQQLTPMGFKNFPNKIMALDSIIEQTEQLLGTENDPKKVEEIITYGSSLGGARPKINLKIKGQQFLAKYSVSLDRRPEPKIEYACMKMAQDLGLNVPEIRLGKAYKRDVYFIKRFDRVKGQRLPFISALSLCNWSEMGYQDWSYPLFCDALIKIGKNPKHINADLRELFCRVAFNIAVNNDDDHPRNHGVIYHQNEWRLAPLYDVVSKDSGSQTFTAAMEIGIEKRLATGSNLISACDYFRLSKTAAQKCLQKVFDFVGKNWEDYFLKTGMSKEQMTKFNNAMIRKD